MDNHAFQTSERDIFWDIAKGVTILLVIIGHSLQYSCNTSQEYYDNFIFRFIYGFHMPLFMFVSGLFFSQSLGHHSYRRLFVNKLRQCVLPIASITLVLQLLLRDFSISDYFLKCTGTYWFLWCVLVLSYLVMVIHKAPSKFTPPLCMLLYISMFVMPDFWQLGYVAYMFPFYIVGYFANQYKEKFDGISKKQLITLVVLTGLVYIGLLFLFNTETYIYTSHYSILNGKGWHQVFIDVQRMITGFCGLTFVLGVIKLTYKYYHKSVSGVLSYLGRNTLQLYLISCIPFWFRIEQLFGSENINYGVALITALMVTIGSIVIIEFIKKYRITNFLFFGRTYSNK